jgi:hypothetical protein
VHSKSSFSIPKSYYWDDALNRDDAVVIETFPNRVLAELAAALLEGDGIEARVVADDAGGNYPMLQFIQGVKLLVSPEDEARAREILGTIALEETLEEDQQ